MAAEQWVDHQAKYYRYLIIKGNIIAFNPQQYSGNANVFGSWTLSTSKCTFAVQLSKIDEFIGVGVIDEQYKQRELLNNKECPNWICYYSSGWVTNRQKDTSGNTVSK